MGDVSEYELTAFACFVWSQDPDFGECDPLPTAGLSDIGSRATGLNPQKKAGQSRIADLEGTPPRLCFWAR